MRSAGSRWASRPRSPRHWAGIVAAALGGSAAWWAARHAASAAVRTWQPGTGPRHRAGPLAVRTFGAGERCVVLLHGLTGSGDYFGAAFDPVGTRARVVVPDLLGFGGSLDTARSGFTTSDHLEALDLMLDQLGLADAPLTVAGHSMGAVLALHWAARRGSQTRSVVAWSAPLYTGRTEGTVRVRGLGATAALFGTDRRGARAVCAWMCAHRVSAAWLAVAMHPQMPAAISRQGVLHTWLSYLGGLDDFVLAGGWAAPLAALDDAGVPVLLASGAQDPVPVPGRAEDLA